MTDVQRLWFVIVPIFLLIYSVPSGWAYRPEAKTWCEAYSCALIVNSVIYAVLFLLYVLLIG